MDSASGLIQIMLAPGIMISACALLLLGMNNKYSLVVNRIRLLKDESRKSKRETIKNDSYHSSVDLQIKKLFFRIALIRNAVFSYSVGVALFILTSLLIGFNNISSIESVNTLVIISFLSGMAFLFAGVLFAAVEVWKGYKIVKIEIEDKT
ncbi:MAG: DUF2721 domain-containing protein [Bacteroidales bacterium]|nr:DUF2721 domain-containing protein [Bacteroidales bacterium]